MPMTKSVFSGTLTEDLLARCAERAPKYDRENAFAMEDFEELTDAGYLTAPVPAELGGAGLTLDEVAHQQRRLAYHAAPTALAVNMHLYWVGLVADLWRAGDRSLQWVLEEAAEGKVFAAGHAESGNDLPGLYSTTAAEPVDGGYRFTGRKSFGSLTPVWDYMGMHAMDVSDPAAPKVVHAFMPRDTEGYRIEETWRGVLGMRATKSDDTVLEGAFIPGKYVARVLPTGFAGADAFLLGIFMWALMGFGNVYYGLARRIFDLTVTTVKKKKSLALTRSSMAYHAGVQDVIAEMAIELEGVEPHLDLVSREWSEGVDHGAAWIPKLIMAKYRAVEAAWHVADLALDVAGGFGVFPKSGLERLVRDARLGRIHPTNRFLTREIVAKVMLGLDLDEQPRWG